MQIVMSKYVVTLSKASQADGDGDVDVYIVNDGHRITPWTWTFASRREAEDKFRECVEVVEASQCRRLNASAAPSLKHKQHHRPRQGMVKLTNSSESSDANADACVETDAQA